MSSQTAVRLGVQTPRIVSLPSEVHSLAAADEAIELADAYGVADGFPLDEAQRLVLRAALGERADGSWAAATIANFCARQNGKNDCIAARELAGLLLFGEKLIIHTAHEFSTANESFLRLVTVFENWDDLRRQVRIRYANGEQAIEFVKTGQRLKYRARTGGAGRGFAKADLVVYDEAQHLQGEHVAASGPARLANPNSQSWYAGSGGFTKSLLSWRMRRRALEGGGGRFAYVEFTAEDIRLVDGMIESKAPDLLDRDAWALANPAYGYRITDEALLTAYDELGPELFARECLCIWDPDLASGSSVFPAGAWTGIQDETVAPVGQMVLAVDVNPERTYASIVAADGAGRVELVERRPGTGWVAEWFAEKQSRRGATVAVDASGPARSLVPDLEAAGVTVEKVTEMPGACAFFYDGVIEQRLAVRRHADLDAAVTGALRRASGDVWRWDRRSPAVDISPLVAATVAVWAARTLPPVTSWQPMVASV